MTLAVTPAAGPDAPFTHQLVTQDEPQQAVHVVRIDLTDPRVTIEIPPAAPDPDGPGPWETTLQQPSLVAAEKNLVVAVNAGFFAGKEKIALLGVEKPYFRGNWGRLIGPGLHDSAAWSVHDRHDWPLLVVTDAGQVRIGMFEALPEDAEEVVAGSHMLLEDGMIVAPADPADPEKAVRHPRTAAGVTQDGRTMLLVVADGRREGHALGMTLAELAAFMKEAGAYDALNLDGGGSSTLVMAGPNGTPAVVNRPSDGGQTRFKLSIERPVANVVGVRVREQTP
ncbi:MAG: phosphodiester glycosidase family protein [Phycisphaerae bacterium]